MIAKGRLWWLLIWNFLFIISLVLFNFMFAHSHTSSVLMWRKFTSRVGIDCLSLINISIILTIPRLPNRRPNSIKISLMKLIHLGNSLLWRLLRLILTRFTLPRLFHLIKLCNILHLLIYYFLHLVHFCFIMIRVGNWLPATSLNYISFWFYMFLY